MDPLAREETQDVKIVKLPLGGIADLAQRIVGKVYVPTKWGGEMTLSGTNVQLYYTDGSDLDIDTAVKIVKGELDAKRVANGNPCTYTAPKDKFRWYYVKVTAGSATAVASTFKQSKTVSKAPWACPSWYPFAAEWTVPHMYDADGGLEKYDRAYGKNSLGREKRNVYVVGHFCAKKTLREQDAELTWGYDFDDADHDGDVWSGWDENVAWDVNQDGNANGQVDVSWIGHCGAVAAIVICENEPTGDFNAPNGVVFHPAEKKALLVALYHGYTSEPERGPDVLPHWWHQILEQRIVGNDAMFGCDVENWGPGPDEVWSHAIYELTNAEYKEKPAQSDEKVVEIACQVKFWNGLASEAKSLYYRYNVSYDAGGVAASSTDEDWLGDHPSAPPGYEQKYRTPDSVWVPQVKTEVSLFWNRQLDYGTIRDIVPAP